MTAKSIFYWVLTSCSLVKTIGILEENIASISRTESIYYIATLSEAYPRKCLISQDTCATFMHVLRHEVAMADAIKTDSVNFGRQTLIAVNV